MNKYVNNGGMLKDNKILEDICKARKMYENGELVETHDVLLEIIKAIEIFTTK